MSEFKTGFVTVVGKPNVGKSTLINALLREKISIVSPKPQTTRNSIKCILMGDDYQVILVDTPGIHKPKNALGEYMMKACREAMEEVDCILFVIDLGTGIGPMDEAIIESLKGVKTPIVLVGNKKDKVTNVKAKEIADSVKAQLNVKAFVAVSAKEEKNVDGVIPEVLKFIPEGPMLYPEDYLTDQPERFVVSEIIREKAMLLLSDEIPYGIGVDIVRMSDRQDKPIVDIEANVICERESHKGMVIGKGGNMLRKIGSAAREDIQSLLGVQVNLKLWVKVRDDWRNDNLTIRSLGYK
ncbi:MAG: GTPase Era [Clostridia bacterium]|nr:GTPase Era [Clostridia bacterium]